MENDDIKKTEERAKNFFSNLSQNPLKTILCIIMFFIAIAILGIFNGFFGSIGSNLSQNKQAEPDTTSTTTPPIINTGNFAQGNSGPVTQTQNIFYEEIQPKEIVNIRSDSTQLPNGSFTTDIELAVFIGPGENNLTWQSIKLKNTDEVTCVYVSDRYLGLTSYSKPTNGLTSSAFNLKCNTKKPMTENFIFPKIEICNTLENGKCVSPEIINGN